MFLFILVVWLVDDILPWFLPKRFHELVSGLVHSKEPIVYLVKSVPFGRWMYEWMLQVGKGPERMEEICMQNRLIHVRLQEIQKSLATLAEQSIDFQSELYEMQKRIIDIQEDHLVVKENEFEEERFFNTIEERRQSLGEKGKKTAAPLLDIRQQKLF